VLPVDAATKTATLKLAADAKVGAKFVVNDVVAGNSVTITVTDK
jgi:uncharacterized protein (DUF39 family)